MANKAEVTTKVEVSSINDALKARGMAPSEAMEALVAADVKANGPLPTKAYPAASD